VVNLPRHFVYKMTTDNGGAPCADDGLLTLAICKPVIRSSADICDWIYGFGGERLEGRLIYIAEVNYKLENGFYYRRQKYAKRPDCIYRYDVKNGRFVRKGSAIYHEGTDNLKRDVGEHPDYRKANVLLSCDFRYLGNEGKTVAEMKGEYHGLRILLDNLKRGHRVNHDRALVEELKKLREEVWCKYRDIKKVGNPSHEDPSELCSCDWGPVEISS
jgi:hypothetical protein